MIWTVGGTWAFLTTGCASLRSPPAMAIAPLSTSFTWCEAWQPDIYPIPAPSPPSAPAWRPPWTSPCPTMCCCSPDQGEGRQQTELRPFLHLKRDYLSDCARKKTDTSARGWSNVCSLKSFLLHAEDSVGHMDVVLETKWTTPHVILDTQCNNTDLSETYNHQVQHM